MPTEMFLNKAVDLLVNQERSIKLLSNQINNIYYIIKLFFIFTLCIVVLIIIFIQIFY